MITNSRATSSISIHDKSILPAKSSYHIPFSSIYLSNNSSNQMNYVKSEYNIQSRVNSEHFDDCYKHRNDHLSLRQQSNYAGTTEFDNYSQVVTEAEDNFSSYCETEQRDRCNDSINFRYSNPVEFNYPYLVKAGNHLASIENGLYSNGDSLKNIYRAVEYTKSSDGERVRVTNSEDFISEMNSIKSNKLETIATSGLTEEIQTKNLVLEEEHEKTFIVKLFPMDDQEREVQEMSLNCM